MSELMEHRLQQYLQEVLVEDYVTLRDFFAGCALIGYINNINGYTHDNVAQSAYKAADAMIAARKEHPND